MRVVVTGATGNVGTAVVRRLEAEPAVDSILGIARRIPGVDAAKAEWAQADVAADELDHLFAGADVVVHLAWLIQPSRDRAETVRVNVEGSRRVFAAAARAGAAVVHASSVGAYSPGPHRVPVREDWPTDGIHSSFYSRDKAAAERLLDALEREHPGLRVVRLRPGLIFQRRAAEEIRRYFAGPLLHGPSLPLLPIVPDVRGVRFKAVHSEDVAEAYRLAVVREDARGAYNVAAEPVLTLRDFAAALVALPVPFPAGAARAAAALTWRARLQPTPEGWVDLALRAPLLDTTRIRSELGWTPAWDGREAVRDLLQGFVEEAGGPSPVLSKARSGRFRVQEWRTGVGARNP